MSRRFNVAPPNLVDRVVGIFNPQAMVGRLRARTQLQALRGGYAGGKRGRKATHNHNPDGGSADADTLPDLPTLRSRSRDLARNVPVATGAIATNKTHVIGSGLKAKSACDYDALEISEDAARAWNKQADREFELACKSIDFAGRMNFGPLQAMMFGSELESGDVFGIRRYRKRPGQIYGTKVQVIEADRVCNPHYRADTDTLAGGVEFDKDGVPVAIHVANRHPGDLYRRPTEWRRIPMRYNDGRRIVIHLASFDRPDQSRGVPYFAPVIEALKSFGDYQDAEVRAAVITAMFTVFVTSAAGDDAGPLGASEESSVGSDEEKLELGSGAIVGLNHDEDIKFADPNRPNKNFDTFAKAFLRLVGVALELPFELLVKHFTSSYSASRAALEMAYHTFRKRRERFADDFCQELRAWVIEEAILTGRLEADGFFDDPVIRDAWLRAEWTGPVRITLDPDKDSKADERDVKNLFKTRQQVMTERTGGEFDVKADQAARENERMKDIGQTATESETTDEPPAAEDLKEDLEDA
ncbi:phage portal protein [Hoeflea sp. TYP-13]|uniref:phage portal protein n=1 Tax=Hoeflea sp. TYP-13 TaxID=3230023 RepID=UPI0034C5F7DE